MIYSIILFLLFYSGLWALNPNPDSLKTKVILLGTGMPSPSPTHAGPATAVVYGQRFFLFDAGSGIERRINAAKLPINGPEATFITHLHSDHTLGYPDLILTSWLMRRKKTLQVYGPHGLQRMTDLLLQAWSEDIDVRINGLEKEQRAYLKVNVHEINTGLVYDSAGVKITAIPVLHGNWKEAYGYRIDTPDHSIVISGDTRPCPALVEAAKGIDILIHEVYAGENLKPEDRPGGEYWPQYCKEFHTSDVELGKIARQIQPKVLVLSHIIRFGVSDSVLVNGIRKGGYKGKVIVGKDLESLPEISRKSEPNWNPDKAKAEIELRIQAYVGALKKGDATALGNLYTSDAQILNNGRPSTIGRENITEVFKNMIRDSVTSSGFTTTGLWGNDELLVEQGNGFFAHALGKWKSPGRYLLVWKKVDGEWKIFRDTWFKDGN